MSNSLDRLKNIPSVPIVAVVGGGLAGLMLAHLLHQRGVAFQLFEARERFGGRILGAKAQGEDDFCFDLGPSWVWPQDQPLIARFLAEQGLVSFEQWQQGQAVFQHTRESPPQRFPEPGSYAGAQRLQGGSAVLIERLLDLLPLPCLSLQHELLELADNNDHVGLCFRHATGELVEYKATQVALMMPPRLLAERVAFNPPLGSRLLEVMRDTPTWMASHAKVMVEYAQPFWRQQGLSGNGFANYPGCVLGEIFDSGSSDGSTAALGGFFALPLGMREKHRDELTALVLAQLRQLFGADAATPLAVHIQDWTTESFTATALDELPLQEHPQYGHKYFQLDHWNDKLYFGGSETSTHFGGYLEGALYSAHQIARQLLS